MLRVESTPDFKFFKAPSLALLTNGIDHPQPRHLAVDQVVSLVLSMTPLSVGSTGLRLGKATGPSGLACCRVGRAGSDTVMSRLSVCFLHGNSL